MTDKTPKPTGQDNTPKPITGATIPGITKIDPGKGSGTDKKK